MIDSTAFGDPDEPSLDVTELRELVRLGQRFEDAWRGGGGTLPAVEMFLVGVPEARLAAADRHLRSVAAELAGGTVAPPPAPARYRIGPRIGAGGMGVVYRAFDNQTGAEVALKQIRPEAFEGLPPERRAELIARFEREGQLARAIEHDHVVAILDIGACDGIPYFTMRWIDGGTLSDRLASGPLPALIAAELLLPVVLAVAEAHRGGVIHRDIKPRNIFLDAAGRPYLGDFGLAKASGLAEPDLTMSGMLLGTAPYMAPEQVRASRRADEQCDVYALGATLYCAITGRPPFQAPELAEVLAQVLNIEPAAPRVLNPGLPRDLERIVLKCLSKAPGDRYRGAGALAEDLGRFLAGLPVRARPPGRITRAIRRARRSPASAGLVGMGAVMALGTALGVLWWGDQRRIHAADRAITALRGAGPADTPALLAGLDWFCPREAAMLEAAHAGAEPGSSAWFNLALGRARLGSPPAGLEVHVLSAHADQVASFLGGLPRGAVGVSRFREALDSETRAGPERLRAAAILLRHEAGGGWADALGRELAVPLLDEPPATLATWADLLAPIADRLADPLHAYLRDRSIPDSRRLAASQVLAAWYARPGSGARLPEAIASADGAQVRVLAGALPRHPALMDELGRRADSGPDGLDARARWAAALVLAGRPGHAWALLPHGPDNGLRTILLLNLAGWLVPPETLLDRLAVERDVSARRALILALGEYRIDLLPPHLDRRASTALASAFVGDADPGVHSAALWTLGRAWKRPLPEARPPAGARWVVEGGQALAFVAGGGARPFAIATTEVTTREFYRLCPEIRAKHPHGRAPADDLPISNVNLGEALRFCAKLSLEVGNRRTFRLPTRTEWEEAAAAGATTSRFHGDREEELDHFAWTLANSGGQPHPVGELRPNDLGLFDVLGNLYEWQDPCDLDNDGDLAMTRGGGFALITQNVRLRRSSPIRRNPEIGESHTGFRVARDLDRAEIATAITPP